MQLKTSVFVGSLIWAILSANLSLCAEPVINLLVIMTDQQRFDALSAAGNTVLQTPNLDRIAHEGVRFENAYTPSPVCAAARTSILTGLSLDNTGVASNREAYSPERYRGGPSFDIILSEAGYEIGYYGKWNSPYVLASRYNNPVTATRGSAALGISGARLYRQFLDAAGVPAVDITKQFDLPDGLLRDEYTERAYMPNIADRRYGLSIQQMRDTGQVRQRDILGTLQIEASQSLTAMQAGLVLDAIDSLAGKPFSLTVSFHSPHPPFTPPEPYASRYHSKDMPLPPNFTDEMKNSPYVAANHRRSSPQFRDPDKVSQFIATYYGLIKELDDWVGKILTALEQRDLLDRTLIVFVSDHGEMLGSHGMNGKSVFYEESVRVPFLMRLPKFIRPGTVVKSAVSTRDIFPTVLDYLGQSTGTRLDSKSLRGVIEGTETRDLAISEWQMGEDVPAYMVRSGIWKLLIARSPEARSIDALYNLQDDPYEMDNLLFEGWPAAHAEVAAKLKAKLVAWLQEIGSPSVQGVNNRKLPQSGNGHP